MDWTAGGVLISIMVALVAGSARYIKLSVKEELSAFKKELMAEIKQEFSAKEVTDLRMRDMERRLNMLEERSHA